MKFSLLCLLTIFSIHLSAQEYSNQNINLLGTWAIPNDLKDEFGDHYSSCWGYAQNGREYAIVGCANGTAYIDVTDPANPVFVDFVESVALDATWREYKTYQHYAYQVSDDGGPNQFDIVDLSYLPDSVHVAYSGTDIFTRAHTIFIDGSRMYRGGNMKVYDLSNDPTKPELLLDNTVGYVHDMFVRNDTVYASQGDNGLFIYKFTGSAMDLLGSFTGYPFGGYNHSSILTPDGKTLLFADEVPQNLPGKSLDVTDISNPVLLDTFYTQTGKATLHNPFLAYNNTFVMASYKDGVQVYDYSDPIDIKLKGYFDTHWQSDSTNVNGGYNGAWSAYTELPSKNLIVVDITNGLYVLDATKAYFPEILSKKELKNATKITTYPNPSSHGFQVEIPAGLNGNVEVKIINTAGQMMYHNIMDTQILQQHKFSADNKWAAGAYLIQLTQDSKVFVAEHIIR